VACVRLGQRLAAAFRRHSLGPGIPKEKIAPRQGQSRGGPRNPEHANVARLGSRRYRQGDRLRFRFGTAMNIRTILALASSFVIVAGFASRAAPAPPAGTPVRLRARSTALPPTSVRVTRLIQAQPRDVQRGSYSRTPAIPQSDGRRLSRCRYSPQHVRCRRRHAARQRRAHAFQAGHGSKKCETSFQSEEGTTIRHVRCCQPVDIGSGAAGL
jgi:hypothetical protein